jgi:uncharacterized membrane protein YcgQ (UPF0703/DUF1980 family)
VYNICRINGNANNVVYAATKTADSVIRKSNEVPKADLTNILEIKDNFFIQQTNDLYYNTDDYIGKTIKIEGYVYSYEDYKTGEICYAVVRNTPGCCGADGLAGVDIRCNGEYPTEKTWVEVVGVMQTDIVDGEKVPAIQVSTIHETKEGVRFVTN